MDKTLLNFQMQVSESFHSKVSLLEKIIGGNHWLTSGTFKETVLINFLNQHLPNRYRAKSGFVVFPTKRIFKKNIPKNYDYLNKSAYTLSKQIDILIYDSLESCPIYKDENIVLLAPESVKNVIEVKGFFNNRHFNDAINVLTDFSNKWEEYKSFSTEYHIENELPIPNLYIYAWETKKIKKGQRGISGKYVRKKLAALSKERSTFQNFRELPMISRVYVYNDYEVFFSPHTRKKKNSSIYITTFDFITMRGYNVLLNEHNNYIKGGDKTLFSLLRDILYSNNLLKNRFLLDTDESNRLDVLPHIDSGSIIVFNPSKVKI